MVSSVFFLKLFHLRLELKVGTKSTLNTKKGHTLFAVESMESRCWMRQRRRLSRVKTWTRTGWSLPGFEGQTQHCVFIFLFFFLFSLNHQQWLKLMERRLNWT